MDKAGIPESCFTPNTLRGTYHLSLGQSQWLPNKTWLGGGGTLQAENAFLKKAALQRGVVKACLFGGGLLYKRRDWKKGPEPNRKGGGLRQRSYCNTTVKSHKGMSTKKTGEEG